MKYLLLSALACVSLTAQALELDIAQSSPEVKWHSISNRYVQLIYPDYLQGESVYIANLIEHYSQFVGQTYGIEQPESFSLIIRPEMAEPNGFVTLAPRRSEWFASSMFFPFVGSTEWYQTLSIHEYRHVNQMDHFKHSGITKYFYLLMGDIGEEIAVAMALPSWYLEGDAVWAETKYTDGGRGRSPRFMARLKALVTSGQIPTYDEFLSGTYRTELPNQYVYGFALISYGTAKYGEDIWRKVTENAASFPNPFAFYTGFRNVTGQKFDDFYAEAMNDLKTKWGEDPTSTTRPRQDYRENSSPYRVGESLYYIRQTMDSYATLYREGKGPLTKVRELEFNPEILSMSIASTKAVYTEYLPDKRYLYKGRSELILLDLATGQKASLTHGERIYQPSLNAAETKIIATDFRPDQTWNISEFNLQGQQLQTFALPDSKVAEARYLDDQQAVVLLNSKIGEKSIVLVDLQKHQITRTLLPPSRNLINSLMVDKNKNILFEAQYKGQNDIFKLDARGLSRCTNAALGAYTPSSDGQQVYYSQMDADGSKIESRNLSACAPLAIAELVGFQYLGDSPSDHYNPFPVQNFPDQAQLFTRNDETYESEDYGDFDKRLLIPHTWGLNLGRGGGLIVQSDNYLRTLSVAAQAGSDAEERKGFTSLSVAFKKYYPIFNFQLESRNRAVDDFATDNQMAWQENGGGISMALPFIQRRGLNNFVGALVLNETYIHASKYRWNDLIDLDTENSFYKSGGELVLNWNRDATARSILAPWLLNYRLRYDQADRLGDSSFSSRRSFQEALLQTPGIFNQDGLQFSFDQQLQSDSPTAYRFLAEGATPTGYVFSRGYEYKSVSAYQKLSGNYVFPIAYPDWNAAGWYYLKRIYSTVFFDSTTVQDPRVSPTLNSYGAELKFESTIIRFIPAIIGGRVLQRLSDNRMREEAFAAVGTSF